MASDLSSRQLTIAPTPTAHFGTGAIRELGPLIAATKAYVAVIVTDAGLLATPVIDAVRGELAAAGVLSVVFGGVHANPTTDDIAAGAEVVARSAAPGDAVLVAVG